MAYKTLTLSTFSGQRYHEILSGLYEMATVFDIYLNAVDNNKQDNVTSLERHAPEVTSPNWSILQQRYHKYYFSDVEAIVVNDVRSFTSIFEPLRTRGKSKMNDILGFLSVLAALHYMYIRLREVFFGTLEVEAAQQEQYCCVRAYKFYEYAVNHFLLSSSGEALKELRHIVHRVHTEFPRLILPNDTLQGDISPHPEEYKLHGVFEIIEKSRPELFVPHYADHLNVTPGALQNWVALSTHSKRIGISSREFAAAVNDPDCRNQCDVGFYKWRLTAYHLGFRWYVPNAHLGILLAGLGARIAAVLFFGLR
ncbi:hypothetical protein V5799_008207 [Amblyomma americanum]|uniref:Uncharacterized protein n=1 Tax=Amblyomma americanum TaxID=6943 RepID=A0AAQ4FFJ8_AMBAM